MQHAITVLFVFLLFEKVKNLSVIIALYKEEGIQPLKTQIAPEPEENYSWSRERKNV